MHQSSPILASPSTHLASHPPEDMCDRCTRPSKAADGPNALGIVHSLNPIQRESRYRSELSEIGKALARRRAPMHSSTQESIPCEAIVADVRPGAWSLDPLLRVGDGEEDRGGDARHADGAHKLACRELGARGYGDGGRGSCRELRGEEGWLRCGGLARAGGGRRWLLRVVREVAIRVSGRELRRVDGGGWGWVVGGGWGRSCPQPLKLARELVGQALLDDQLVEAWERHERV